jgi:hypothetical protein
MLKTLVSDGHTNVDWFADEMSSPAELCSDPSPVLVLSDWSMPERVAARSTVSREPPGDFHAHGISRPSAFALRLAAWLFVLMTVSAQTYNGWPNYATWYVFVWANACAGDYWRERISAICDGETLAETAEMPLVRNERIRKQLVQELTEWVQQKNPLREQASLYGDLLRGVIGEVDWMRIADNWLTDLEESRRRRPLTESALRA